MQFRTYEDLIKAAGVQGYDFRASKAQPTPCPLYFRRTVAAAAIAANTKLKFFHKGIGDDLAGVGGTTGTAITKEQTNLQAEGRLAQGELFICTGIALQVSHAMPIADYLALADCTVTWSENSDTLRKTLGQFEDFPAQVGPSYLMRNISATSGVEERLVRSEGRAYMTGAPLFYIRGGVEKHDQGALELEVITGFTPAAGHIKAKLYGVYFRKLAGG